MASEVCFANSSDTCVEFEDSGGQITADAKLVPIGNGDLECVNGQGLRTVIRRAYDKASTGRQTVNVQIVGPDQLIRGGGSADRAVVQNPSSLVAGAQLIFEGVIDVTLAGGAGADARCQGAIEWRWITHSSNLPDPWTGFEGSWSWVAQEVNKQFFGWTGTAGQTWLHSFRFTGVEEANIPAGHYGFLESRLVLDAIDGNTEWDTYVLVNQIFVTAARS